MGLAYKDLVTSPEDRFENFSVFDSLSDVPAGMVGPVFTADGKQYFADELGAYPAFDTMGIPLNLQMPKSIIDLSGTIGDDIVKTGSAETTLETSIKAPDQSVAWRVSVAAAGSSTLLVKDLDAPLNLADTDIVTFLLYTPWISNPSTQQATFRFYTGPSGTVSDSYNCTFTFAGGAKNVQQVSLKKSDFTTTGTPDWQDIRAIRFQVSAVADMAREVWLLGIYAQHKPRPTVCLMFDDGTVSDFTEVHQYCSPRNIPCSFGLIPSFHDVNANYMTTRQIRELIRFGHEMNVHDTGTLQETYLADPAGFSAHLAQLKAWVAQFDPSGANFMTWPQGRYGDQGTGASNEVADAILSIAKEHFKSMRNTSSVMFFNTPPLFPSVYGYELIRSRMAIDNPSTPTTVKAAIDNAIAYGESLFLFGHSVVASGATSGQTNRADFQEIVDYLVTKRDAYQIDPLTYSQWYRRSRLASQQLLMES